MKEPGPSGDRQEVKKVLHLFLLFIIFILIIQESSVDKCKLAEKVPITKSMAETCETTTNLTADNDEKVPNTKSSTALNIPTTTLPFDFSHAQDKKLPLMSDVVICLCGVHGEEQSAVLHAVQEMGGEVTGWFVSKDKPDFLARKPTHLVTNKSDINEPKIARANKMNLPIVSPAWVYSCQDQLKLVDATSILVSKKQLPECDQGTPLSPSL